MINGRTVIAIVPARGGSKGLPGKNLRLLCGKPLVAWTIEQALQARHVDTVILSTDSEEIARVGVHAGASVPFLRPASLATDESPTLDAVEHLLDTLRTQQAKTFDYVALLEPTSPLRESADIDGVLARLDAEREHYDAVITVGEMREHPSLAMRLNGDAMQPFCSGLEIASRRQDQVPAYFPYGAVYAVKTHVLRDERTFFPRRSTYFQLQPHQNHEIDDIHDFRIVEAIMRSEWNVV